MNRRGTGSIVANPVLVGAVTVLVTVVAVFLAYNANQGLPFVPTQQLNVEIENGEEVVPGVEVREGGFRIGAVTETQPTRLSNGKVGALLKLKLDEVATPIPADSRIIVRPRSPLALKIVEFHRGESRRTIEDGGRLPVGQARANTDLDELFTMQDAPTREGQRNSLVGFGNAFSARGLSLNDTIRGLPGLFRVLEPVMRNLGDPETRLPRFFQELADVTRVVAPISEVYARGFTQQADTWEAISRDPQALKDTISKSPPTMDTSIRSFRVQRPFLRDTTAFSRDLNAVAEDLRAALPTINDALEVGTPVTRRSVRLNNQLRLTMRSLRELAAAPTTDGALRGLTATVATLNPTVRFIGPSITVCNYWNIFWTFAAEHLSSPDPTGSSQRVLFNTGDDQKDKVTAFGANEFVNGEGVRGDDHIRQYLHGNTTAGLTIHPDGKANCVPGQQGYLYAANRFEEHPGYERVVVDQMGWLFPGDLPRLGSTYSKFDTHGRGHGRNRDEVPEGQTYTWVPGGHAALTEYDREALRRFGPGGRR